MSDACIFSMVEDKHVCLAFSRVGQNCIHSGDEHLCPSWQAKILLENKSSALAEKKYLESIIATLRERLQEKCVHCVYEQCDMYFHCTGKEKSIEVEDEKEKTTFKN